MEQIKAEQEALGIKPVIDPLVEGEYVRMNSQKKEGEILFEQLRLVNQVKDRKIVNKNIVRMLYSWTDPITPPEPKPAETLKVVK